MSDTGIIIGLKMKLTKLEAKVERLEKVLCPECRKRFQEILKEKE
ncbi:MAG: hypothetical protein OEY39_02930 [Candidatus Bathyarchaeota archaeon]|nr:hypothetical protein [Candidatus Bathyarchaeota archaeon]MDH5623401.1 hypothetical protein [Candidatus Bathyarchaeota archaeon]MDH5635888.1 hypothetical protein [Candidatus Bathyarchaeota archaeon]MDH5702100.1 hypothetical protein [Candidatus Bathyarchaeota archaeon]